MMKNRAGQHLESVLGTKMKKLDCYVPRRHCPADGKKPGIRRRNTQKPRRLCVTLNEFNVMSTRMGVSVCPGTRNSVRKPMKFPTAGSYERTDTAGNCIITADDMNDPERNRTGYCAGSHNGDYCLALKGTETGFMKKSGIILPVRICWKHIRRNQDNTQSGTEGFRS